ncbi:MAG: translation initiation factor Sui1 [Luminiphilus sp.]|nr:translation initiation factor Sui1 [Luminiphilus sp.]
MAKSAATRAVYSTDGGRLCPQCQRPVRACVCGTAKPANADDGIVRIRRETKGRGGKAVTVIEGIPEHPEGLKSLCKQLKQRCGVGGSVKDSAIEIQGDQRTTCQQVLATMGYQVKLSGG